MFVLMMPVIQPIEESYQYCDNLAYMETSFVMTGKFAARFTRLCRLHVKIPLARRCNTNNVPD